MGFYKSAEKACFEQRELNSNLKNKVAGSIPFKN
jgi:hypothetical protein